jgi:hypothetical protein
MSKDTPEVGDVWIDKDTHRKIVFVMVSDYYCEYLEHNEKLCESFDVYSFITGTNKWKKGKKYLGKSKANIDDLFKTEE